MARARPSIEEAKRALIVKPSSLGDVVHALPIPGLLKMANPDLRIAWVANPEWAPLVAGHPHVDEVIEFPRRAMRGLAAPARFWRWAKSALRAGGAPDLCLDLQCLFRSALIAKASGARWIGGLSDAREGAGLFYDASADVAGIAHAVDRYLAAPRQLLGIDFSAADVAFPLGEGEPVTPAPPDGFVLLHPFSRGGGKSLDPAAAAAYCEALAPRPVAVVGRFDAPCPLPGNAIDLLNQTSLAQLIWLARRAAFTISVDSGPLHIAAAAAGPRTLGLHTWSDPRKVGPYAKAAWVWKGGAFRQVAALPADPESGGDTAFPSAAALGDFAGAQIDRLASDGY